MKKNHVTILCFLGAVLFLLYGGYNLVQPIILSLMFNAPIMFRFLVKPLIALIIGIVFLICGINVKQKNKIKLKDFMLKNKKTIIATICMLFGASLCFVGIIFGGAEMTSLAIPFILVGGIIAGFSSMLM